MQKRDKPVFVLTDIWMQYIRSMTPKTKDKSYDYITIISDFVVSVA